MSRKYGPVYSEDTNNNEKYIYCKKCGFAFNAKEHPKGVGDGNSATTDTYTTTTGITQYYGDPDTDAGCPLCGTFNYD